MATARRVQMAGVLFGKTDCQVFLGKSNSNFSEVGIGHSHTVRHSRHTCNASRMASVSLHALLTVAQRDCVAGTGRVQFVDVNL